MLRCHCRSVLACYVLYAHHSGWVLISRFCIECENCSFQPLYNAYPLRVHPKLPTAHPILSTVHPHLTTPHHTSHHLISPHLTPCHSSPPPHHSSPHLTTAHPHLTTVHPTSPQLWEEAVHSLPVVDIEHRQPKLAPRRDSCGTSCGSMGELKLTCRPHYITIHPIIMSLKYNSSDTVVINPMEAQINHFRLLGPV